MKTSINVSLDFSDFDNNFSNLYDAEDFFEFFRAYSEFFKGCVENHWEVMKVGEVVEVGCDWYKHNFSSIFEQEYTEEFGNSTSKPHRTEPSSLANFTEDIKRFKKLHDRSVKFNADDLIKRHHKESANNEENN